ncbi:ABC transporter ATP-binding protein [Geofilum rhodophaeum]|uniref:ABC transporter ATP-binding protein n=1 Tax=Geofilum rhodophaeum TaxID=1965019 RepID=UPI000B523A20|nr:ABC transporter ATP-binding protein [Geofilum rhodophaeum]
MSTLISIEGLGKLYPKAGEPSLKEVSFNIHQGERFGIFGPNGAGKTTLISILCQIIPATEGQVRYFIKDREVSFSDIKQHIGFVPQDLALYEGLTAFQNVEYFGALFNMSAFQVRERAAHLFGLLGLSQVANKPVKTFSGGMKRRLNLIVGVMHEPGILFLDEPTVGVDIQSRTAILEFLNTLNESGTSIVYTSHHLDEAERFCDRIAVIDRGRVIALDEIGPLLREHAAADLTHLLIKLTGKEFRDHV